MEPLTTECHHTFRAAHDSGTRPLSQIELFVFHVAEAPTAIGVAEYFHSAASGGSTQLVVDDDTCYRCLPNGLIPWAAPGANSNGVHCEIAGYANWPRREWLQHQKRLERAAYKAALHCRLYGLPPRLLGPAALARGMKGFTTHHAVNMYAIAENLPGDHSHSCPFPRNANGTVLTIGYFPLDVVTDLTRKWYTDLAHVQQVA